MNASCRQSALRFLKIRPRSITELKEKLQRKNFEPQDVEETLKWLENIKLLDDRSFTKSWIAYRLARPFGFRRIITELKAKGVAAAIIEKAVEEAQSEYAAQDVVMELALRRWNRLPDIDVQKKKKRVYDFLIRRGFAMDIVMKALKKL